MLTRGRELSDDELDALLASPQGAPLADMMRYTAVGTGAQAADQLAAFAASIDADELMVVHASPGIDARLRSVQLLADAAH